MSKPSNEFSIKATVNRNIEKHQYPYFHAHRSLLGTECIFLKRFCDK